MAASGKSHQHRKPFEEKSSRVAVKVKVFALYLIMRALSERVASSSSGTGVAHRNGIDNRGMLSDHPGGWWSRNHRIYHPPPLYSPSCCLFSPAVQKCFSYFASHPLPILYSRIAIPSFCSLAFTIHKYYCFCALLVVSVIKRGNTRT